MEDTGLFKFIAKGQTSPTNTGIRTFPHHTYGVSKQSPDHFKQRHTIVNPQGYLYQHQKAPQFEYKSQHKTLVLDHPATRQNKQKSQQLSKNNPYKYHLKKGRLGQFWDKNSWMNTVYVMNGFQRSKKSRDVNNQERTMKVKSLKKPIQYDSHLFYKPKFNLTGLTTKEDIMSEKVRIRNRRNQEAKRQIPLSQRKLHDSQACPIDIQTVKSKMAQTTSEWHKGSKRSKINRQFSLHEPFAKFESEQLMGDDLQEWQRKTCKAKWCYRVAKDDFSENEQEKL